MSLNDFGTLEMDLVIDDTQARARAAAGLGGEEELNPRFFLLDPIMEPDGHELGKGDSFFIPFQIDPLSEQFRKFFA